MRRNRESRMKQKSSDFRWVALVISKYNSVLNLEFTKKKTISGPEPRRGPRGWLPERGKGLGRRADLRPDRDGQDPRHPGVHPLNRLPRGLLYRCWKVWTGWFSNEPSCIWLFSEGVEQCVPWKENTTQQIDLAFNIFFMVYFFIRVSVSGSSQWY